LSKEDEFLTVSNARVTSIEFTFEGDNPVNIAKERRKKARLKAKRRSLLDFVSVLPENETQVMEAALEAYRKRRPVEVYEDLRGRIVKIQPKD
jgi:hypothetical protein